MTTASIKGFNRVEACGVFSSWPKGHIEFGRYNIIYGWNGSGKTTLSRIFRSLELESLSGALSKNPSANFEIQLGDDTKAASNNLAGWKDKIRVFNKDFIKDNVHDDGNDLAPVFHLGKEQGDALEKLKEANDQLELKRKEQSVALKAHATHLKGAAAKVTENARVVRETLGYTNFNAARLKPMLDGYTAQKQNTADLLLEEKKLEDLKNTARGANDKQKLTTHQDLKPIADSLYTKATEILERDVIKSSIDELDNNPALKEWVDTGHTLHESRETCAFCASKLTDARKTQLSDYFNAAYKTLQADILRVVREVKSAIPTIAPHNDSELYATYSSEHKTLVEAYKNAAKDFVANLNAIEGSLESKPNHLNEKLTTIKKDVLTSSEDALIAAAIALNDCVTKHNQHYDDFEKERTSARDTVAAHYAASFYNDYVADTAKESELEKALKPLADAVKALEDERDQWEKKLQEHDIALPRINELLQAFLGRTDIQLDTHDSGYHVKRNGDLAENLSEGERTAIAFTYFIAKMEEKHFDLANAIVVIDDPISSLDSNSLYAAGAFIRCHLEQAQQLFILTHNHQFFREIYGWIRKLQNVSLLGGIKSDKGYFMLKCETKDGVRQAAPCKLETLLRDYDSEYVFLCKQLFDNRGTKFDSEDNDQLAKLMMLPNAARRVLETFLLFKFPDLERNNNTINIFNKIKALGIAFPVEKTSLLDRLINRGSHGDESKASTINMLELSEVPKAIDYVLDFLKAADPTHYTGLQEAAGIKPDLKLAA